MTALIVVVVGAAALLAIIAATRPDQYEILRVATINAPPERVFPLLVDFRQWPRWSPFEALDPAMRRTYSGPPSGVGAIYDWEGNRQAGRGRMEIVEATPPKSVAVKVDFAKPFVAHNLNKFTLGADHNTTKVTWGMHGTRPFVLKVMMIFVSPDKLLGSHFERGLANLKAASEQESVVARRS
jgi:uncharacterized protein YndB with AHSA1/START domain